MNTHINTTLAASNPEQAATRKIRTGEVPVLGQPSILLRIEGLVLLAGSLLLYARNGGEWVPFLALLLVPDLSMVGYLKGPAAGAALYNLFHNYLPAAGLAAFGVLGGNQLLLLLALIWLAHIGMDRVLGYGLKYSSGFKDTHIGRS
ncbi:MAG: DUF4260 domain-containing protein [Chloroflexota bacterium]